MSNFYFELDLEKVIQCPICFELPTGFIFLCRTGHHMCHKCRKKLTSCPSCQSALTGCRNFVAEELMTKFSFLKDGDIDNGRAITISQQSPVVPELRENTTSMKSLTMPKGRYKCLLESCRNRKEMGVGNLIPHVASAHNHLFEKFQNNSATFTSNFENFCFLSGKHKYHRAFQVTNMGLFFLNLEVLGDNYINCWISTPAPIRKANMFDYEIKFIKEGSDHVIRFVNKVASNVHTSSWLLERGRAFVISPAQHVMNDNEFFSLPIKIVYKAPSS